MRTESGYEFIPRPLGIKLGNPVLLLIDHLKAIQKLTGPQVQSYPWSDSPWPLPAGKWRRVARVPEGYRRTLTPARSSGVPGEWDGLRWSRDWKHAAIVSMSDLLGSQDLNCQPTALTICEVLAICVAGIPEWIGVLPTETIPPGADDWVATCQGRRFGPHSGELVWSTRAGIKDVHLRVFCKIILRQEADAPISNDMVASTMQSQLHLFISDHKTKLRDKSLSGRFSWVEWSECKRNTAWTERWRWGWGLQQSKIAERTGNISLWFSTAS